MVTGLHPKEWGKVCDGDLLDVVCFTKVFDTEHEGHLMINRVDGQTFLYTGFLEDGFVGFTLFDVSLKQQYPCPVLSPTKQTVVLGHRRPTWDALLTTIDLCSGFGGLSQGSIAAGMDVAVSVDMNPKMLDLHGKVHQSHKVCGDFGLKSTLIEIWKHAHGAAVVTSGFSCQPYSKLGDGRGQEDSRSECLTKTLEAAFYLNAQVIVLECVAPAAQDSFVKAELDRFMRNTGFHCSQTDLKLESVWPCRRHRAWWVLTAPDIGPLKLTPWSPILNVSEVQHVIPSLLPWADGDEHALALDEVEMDAFGVNSGSHARYMLNEKGQCPCALHAWGSQTRACPCGCRQRGFATARLEAKGLHGCLARSAPLKNGTTLIRHLHPNEVMGLNTMDPVLDFGPDVRLTLSAAGQIACPAQALWILSFVIARYAELTLHQAFDPNAQIQAYRAWLLMRCRQVWPCDTEVISDPKLVSMMQFWQQFRDLSLAEVLYPLRWVGDFAGPVNIASVLDHIIRAHDVIPATIGASAESDEIEATPWLDQPSICDTADTESCLCHDSCTVVFEGSSDSPLRFQPKCDSTIAQFLVAHRKLVGDLSIESITLNGRIVPDDHVMEVGQVIVIRLASCPGPNENTVTPELVPVSPTATWTQPVEAPHDSTDDPIEVASPPRKVSKFDVGECSIPVKLPDPDDSWLDATPFLGLQGEQFLKLGLPTISNVKQLWSVRHQYFRTQDRLAIMSAQGRLWADDEIRFHLHALVQAHRELQVRCSSSITQLCVLDPLIISSWIQDRGFDCALWGRDHPEIVKQSMPIVTVALIDHHWIPLFMVPVKGVLHVQTWDSTHATHAGLDSVLNRLAASLGLQSALLLREQRMFFTSDLCGALSIAFLRSVLCGALLPTHSSEAEAVHLKLRDILSAELHRCQITRRPWIWGAGDNVPGSSSSVPVNDPFASLHISRDQRIDLINDRGTAFADDEVRFHLIELTEHQPKPRSGCEHPKFLYIEPLVFNCWNSIGKIISERWCKDHPDVVSRGQHVLTCFCVQDHWMPVWFSPIGEHVQVHTLKEDDIELDDFVDVVSCIAHQLGFTSHAVHFIPPALGGHKMCGAQALSFLAHVVMSMPLPGSIYDLRTLLTNMRASFVAHLYSVAGTPRPVVWGFGPPGESGPLPRMPEGDPFAVPCCAFAQDTPAPSRSVFDHFCCCFRYVGGMPDIAEDRALRARRGELLFAHGLAFGDDEMMFHLLHIMTCLQSRPFDGRHFVILPPLAVHQFAQGHPDQLREWLVSLAREDLTNLQVVLVHLLDDHWVPIWIDVPQSRCHLLADFVPDPQSFQDFLSGICLELGLREFVTHSVPHGLPCDKLCGPAAISFIAHITLRTVMPQSIEQLYERAWAMKQVFWTALQTRKPTMPSLWGWGFESDDFPGECGLLPIMPASGPFATFHGLNPVSHALLSDLNLTDVSLSDLSGQFTFGLADHVMQFHINLLRSAVGPDFTCHVVKGVENLLPCIAHGAGSRGTLIALLHDCHWSPVICLPFGRLRLIFFEHASGVGRLALDLLRLEPCVLPRQNADWCGARTWQLLTSCVGLVHFNTVIQTHFAMQAKYLLWIGRLPAISCFGFAAHGALIKSLAAELTKHGVPDSVVEDRAALAINQLGNEAVQTALQHRNPWKQLKILGNQAKFHFVLPSELASDIVKNRGKSVSSKGKGKGATKLPASPIDLDPLKLQVLEGTFQVQGKRLPQLTSKQIGPVSSGFILMSPQDADPYLRAGTQVSSEPLALIVLTRAGVDLQTALPHMEVTVPCRCTLNNEPVLAEAILVQIGCGLVEKTSGTALVDIDTPDVVTFKIMVYKDELQGTWAEFCQAPIRGLVNLLPMLKRCFTADCQCAMWHNHEGLAIRDPILDVWRRQFPRLGFKPCPAETAEIFSVCIRAPACLTSAILAASGSAGAYCEPRTADGREVLADYMVIWTPKHSLQQMLHLQQTNPAVTGLARIGERRGLRVHASQAKQIHKLVRPDSVYLPSGPRTQYTVGPFPFGADRQAVGKILLQAGWECRPLQPTTPCPGRGAMWLVQSTEEPSQTIISTTSGEIMIAKQKHDTVSPVAKPTNVGTAATLALCGTDTAKTNEADPWVNQDPWKSYHPVSNLPPSSGHVEGLKQIEDRIQNSIMAKFQPPMDRDDVPDRVQALEGQVQHLISKQQSLETQFQEHSGHHAQQINALQGQITSQAQQLHGQLENQNQTMQSLFEQQMQQIRGLLAKRPRDDGME